MFRRLFKLLLAVVVLLLIAAAGLVIMINNVEDPLSVTFRNPHPTPASELTSSGPSRANVLECEVKNTSIFPMEILPQTFALLPADDANNSYISDADSAAPALRLIPGETWQGNLYGPQPLNPKDIHTFSYDWNVRGQNPLRALIRWLDQNSSVVPESWLNSLFWQTEPRKGRVKHVPVPVPGSTSAATAPAEATKPSAPAAPAAEAPAAESKPVP